jgi:hypothetical protein
VTAQWRSILAALKFIQGAQGTTPDAEELSPQAARYLSLARIVVGALGAAVYWAAAQVWPTSIAVILCMLATTLIDGRARFTASWQGVFVLLVKFNALMALSSASSPIPLPPFLTLGLILIAAQAVSGAMQASVGVRQRTATDFALLLLIGFAPATLLGIPGLTGLGTAIGLRLMLGRFEAVAWVQAVSEIGFYLGALAAWQFI